MKATRRALWVLALGSFLLGVPGCMEDIALFPRPTLPEGQPDVVGAVEHVDLAARRLYFRLNDGEHRVVVYGPAAQIFYRGREYPMTRLAPGDIIAMQVKQDARGESYVDLVRIQEERVDERGRRKDFAAAPIETLAGTVQSVNRRDNSFELDNRPKRIVSVALAENVRDSDKERFRTLRAGDHVRVEGKFVANDRFEMLSFLNDEY